MLEATTVWIRLNDSTTQHCRMSIEMKTMEQEVTISMSREGILFIFVQTLSPL